MSTEIEVHVECYAGYRGEQQPRQLTFGHRVIKVEEILDQWHGPDYRYFKLKGADNGVYILRREEITGRWELAMFDAGYRNGARLSSS
jgi:hypothetical protein